MSAPSGVSVIDALDIACYRAVGAVCFDHRAAVTAICGAVATAVQGAGVPATVLPFGSTVSGLSVEANCDVDICLVCGVSPLDLAMPANRRYRATLNRVHEALKATGVVSQLVAILGARVPIMKFTVALPSGRQCPVDLCFNMLNGIRNTELQRRLTAAQPRFRPLARLVKLWAKQRLLVGADKHLFSSYALVLLVAAFLQRRALLPVGQAFCALCSAVEGFTPDDLTAWVAEAPNPSTDAPVPKRAAVPPEVDVAVRRVAADEPGLGAKKVLGKVTEMLRGTVSVSPKDVRATLALMKLESDQGDGAATAAAAEGDGGAAATTTAAGPAAAAAATEPSVGELLCEFFAHHAEPTASSNVVNQHAHAAPRLRLPSYHAAPPWAPRPSSDAPPRTRRAALQVSLRQVEPLSKKVKGWGAKGARLR